MPKALPWPDGWVATTLTLTRTSGGLDMPGSQRPFWVVVGAATITETLALTTAIVPDWIEFVFGWNPDHHDGSVERWSVIWLIVAGLYFVTFVLVAAAMREWRRISAVGSSGRRERERPDRPETGDCSN